ncbi:MAG: hypothetical protein K0R39_5205, partial [Symbiobacteriaceae bacterium]|nr:hypothetical protein [Symbiobacteriaceae bacterium]
MISPGGAFAADVRRVFDLVRRGQIPVQVEMAPRPIRTLGRRQVVRVCAVAVNGANADLARFRRDLEMARTIWGQCGIAFAEGSFTPIDADLDYPGWVDYRTAPASLLNQRGGCTAADVRIYYVRSIAGSMFQGRSAFTFGEPGYVALSSNAHPNLFPHELGHLFLGGNEEHRDGPGAADRMNIMRSDVGTIEGAPQVDQNQCMRTRARLSGGGMGGSGQGGAAPEMLLVGWLQHPSPAV